MFKRFLQITFILAGCSALPVWSVMITSGSADNFIDEYAIAGNPGAGTTWVNSTLPTAYDVTARAGNVHIDATDTPGFHTFVLTGLPAYTLVKNVTHIALFENLAGLDQGVVGRERPSSTTNLPASGYPASHETDAGDNGSAPEPRVPGLLGTGLLGISLLVLVIVSGLLHRLGKTRSH